MKYLLLGIWGCMALAGFCQKQDYIWLSGYQAYPHPTYVPSEGFYLGTNVLDFNSVPVKVSMDSLQMNFSRTNVSYSDTAGKLLFYSNGIYVANKFHEKVEFGDSLNAGFLQYSWAPRIQVDGYRTTQGILALESVLANNIYYLFHTYSDTLDGTGESEIYCSRLLMTTLDMSANNGHGRVTNKNSVIILDNLGDNISATKHANGKFWWILVQKRNSNCYYRVLVDSAGASVLPQLTCGGSEFAYPDVGTSCFSPDGSKYACFNVIGGIRIFDFNRCTGELTKPVSIPFNIWSDSSWLGNGIAFSPNGRYLYISATKYVFQYDLNASNIEASIDTVGIYDGFKRPFGSIFSTAQLGPDGKIYISCGSSEAVYHVINKPDLKGDNCELIQHQILLPAPSFDMPNYPNYRLGAQVGNCSSVDIPESKPFSEMVVKVFPNPAYTSITIDYGNADWNMGSLEMDITNELGQVIHQQNLPLYSGLQRVDVSQYPKGFYAVHLRSKLVIVGSTRFGKL